MHTNNTYLNNLIADCEHAKTEQPHEVKTFHINNCKNLDDGIFDGLNNEYYYIYVIREINGNNDATYKSMVSFKKKKTHKCPKLNHNVSDILYVGSSTTGIKKRLLQHCGYGHHETYALHTSHWFTGKLVIDVYIYEQQRVNRSILQLIEDNISYQLNPSFGKQGGNNK